MVCNSYSDYISLLLPRLLPLPRAFKNIGWAVSAIWQTINKYSLTLHIVFMIGINTTEQWNVSTNMALNEASIIPPSTTQGQ